MAGGARESARPSFFGGLAGKGFGRRPWQLAGKQKKSSYQRETERLRRRPRWLVATQPRWTPLQTNKGPGLSRGLGEKALTGVIQELYLSPFGNPRPLIDSLMFLEDEDVYTEWTARFGFWVLFHPTKMT